MNAFRGIRDRTSLRPARPWLASAWLACLLAACGGGGSGPSPAGPAPSTPAPPGPPPTGTVLPGPRPAPGPQSFVAFESGQVRPLALSADGQRLFAVNTPDNRLEILATAGGLTPIASVPVGLEPVAVAVAPDGRVWVVNHLSDSISVVDVDAAVPHVTQTLWVGDEPRDIVFAGAARERAFVTTAHRGQNSPVDPALSTPGIGRADVWVFDSAQLDDTPGGEPEAIVTLFGDRPRPLAVSADGLRVFAGVFLSGNRTTSIAPNGFVKRGPAASADGVPAPDTGLILKFNGSGWLDADGNDRGSFVPFDLPDYDVFEIDAVSLKETRRIAGVGTVLFNMAVSPVDDTIFVSNIDARNHVRFAGTASAGRSSVRGRLTDQRITVIGADGVARPRTVNGHIDFSSPTGSAAERALSLSTLLGMAVSADGTTLYVTAFGSSRVAMFDTGLLADGDPVPGEENLIAVSGGGPSGIVLDGDGETAYVMTRFDNGISTLDLAGRRETGHLTLFNPEPPAITEGRPFLYDARLTSGNGNDSCASCHVFGDTDGLAWDLGDPDATTSPIPNVFIPISPAASPFHFHPMKGPMTTQSMRGLARHGPMHWRGDRTGADRSDGETLEEAAFKEFNEAFDSLMGLGEELSAAEMQAFTDFAMRLSYPPNPIRNLDGTLTPAQARGERLYRDGVVRVQTGIREVCAQCHPLDPAAGLFGTRGLMADNAQPGERNFKIPHFRDQYQKVGMFGWGFGTAPVTGPQIRGFSFNHNGATSSNFIIADLGMPRDDLLDLRAFLYAFPTETPTVTGQQVTVTAASSGAARARVELLVARGTSDTPVPACDLVVHGLIAGDARAWSMSRSGRFRPDRAGAPELGAAELIALLASPDDRLTYLCTPWGSGLRIGIDRDEDGILDGDE